jgi:hypothetical protein
MAMLLKLFGNLAVRGRHSKQVTMINFTREVAFNKC